MTRMRKFGNGRKPQRRDMVKGEPSRKENDPSVCNECKKSWHIKYDCPFWKKQNARSPMKKAMVATWSDSNISDDDSYDK